MVANSLILFLLRGWSTPPPPKAGWTCTSCTLSISRGDSTDFQGKVRKIHAASTLEFWNPSSQDSPFGNSGDMQENAQVLWRGHNNPSWSQLLSHPSLGTRCVREEASRRFCPTSTPTVRVLLAESPNTVEQKVAIPAELWPRSPKIPQHYNTASVHMAKFGVVGYMTIVFRKFYKEYTCFKPFDSLLTT